MHSQLRKTIDRMPKRNGSQPGRRSRAHRAKATGHRPDARQPSRGACAAQRRQLAYEAARMMREQGLVELERARRKAAERLGVTNKRCWPDNAEIQDALLSEYRLFQPETQQLVTVMLREQALGAMKTFVDFDPRLVGPLVSGIASVQQGVRIHLFADDTREIVFRLVDRGIPWQERDCQQRYADGSRQTHPMFAFVAGEVPIELVVLPVRARHNPPLSPVSDRPERGIDTRALEQMISAAPA